MTSPGDEAEGDGAVRSEHAQSLQADGVQLLVETPGVEAGHEELGRVHGQVVLQQTQRLGLLLAPPHLLLLLLVFIQQVLLDGFFHRLLHLLAQERGRGGVPLDDGGFGVLLYDTIFSFPVDKPLSLICTRNNHLS